MSTLSLKHPYNRWGTLQLINIQEHIRRVEQSGGWEEFPDVQLTLICHCGKEFTVWQSEFPGKRKMKDCGCGMAERAKRALVTFCTTDTNLKRITAYALDQRMTLSKACAEIVEIGLTTLDR